MMWQGLWRVRCEAGIIVRRVLFSLPFSCSSSWALQILLDELVVREDWRVVEPLLVVAYRRISTTSPVSEYNVSRRHTGVQRIKLYTCHIVARANWGSETFELKRVEATLRGTQDTQTPSRWGKRQPGKSHAAAIWHGGIMVAPKLLGCALG